MTDIHHTARANPISLEYHISGLNCIDCVRKIENAVSNLKSVDEAKVNFAISSLRVKTVNDCDTVRVEAEIEGAVTRLGFGLTRGVRSADSSGKNGGSKEKQLLILTVASFLLIILGLLAPSFGSRLAFDIKNISIPFYLLVIIAGLYYVGRPCLAAVVHWKLDINVLMCIAVTGAACIGEWIEGATVMFLFLLAQLLETYTLDKARRAVRSLMQITPKEAFVKVGDSGGMVLVDEVRVDDVIMVRPGERIPLDGLVVEGCSTVNQSPVTGESMPVEKLQGDKVYAGSINENGTLDVRVTHTSSNTTLARIVYLIEEAQTRKAPFQRFVDKFALYYTPVVITIAFLTAIVPSLIFRENISEWIYSALVLLVISCPCALVISTPISLISGITSAAKKGILFKGGICLEYIGNIKAVAFDKTGTLTRGEPVVTEIVPAGMSSNDDILRIAASIEIKSEHSVAHAILERARERGISPLGGSNFHAFTGRGAAMEIDSVEYRIGSVKYFRENGFILSGIEDTLSELQNRGRTTILLGKERTVLGVIAVADEVRQTCSAAISGLYGKGIERVVMLTGDYRNTAEAVAGELDIDECMSELAPAEKAAEVQSLMDKYGKTMMVGDGINDAPALAVATVGVAMGKSGTDIALESSDITIINDDLTKLPLAMALGRQTLKIIKQNIAIALAVKCIFLVMVLPGFTTLWMAVGADMGASLIVILNGLRLLRR